MSSPRSKSRKVGRPSLSEEEVQRVRRRIIDTAKELFFANGMESVSMRQIAQKTGYSLRLPYLYFKSKEEILRYIWEDFFVELFESCMKEVKRKRTPENKLRAFLLAYAQYWLEQPDRYELVFMVKNQIGAMDDRSYVHDYGVIGRYQALVELVEDCIADKTFADKDPNLISQLFLSSIHGALLNLIMIPEFPWRSDQELIKNSIEVVFNGMAPKK